MVDNIAITVLVLPGLGFGILYQPMLTRVSIALVSPYSKADVRIRFVAAGIDCLLITATLLLYFYLGSVVPPLCGALYAMLRDAVAGRSVGKLFCGLIVVDLRTGQPCGAGGSIKRNVLWLVPGANLVGGILEALTIVRDPQGQRLGDRLAATQVVEGFGAKDVVAVVQAWWLDFIAHLDGDPRRRRRAPVRAPRSR
jgi:uncharacterized RDD family membrane protein YckC